jgi:hydroxyacylglutathione hydrolase
VSGEVDFRNEAAVGRREVRRNERSQVHSDVAGSGAGPRVTVLKTCCQAMKNYNYLVVDPEHCRAILVDPAWEPEKITHALADCGARLSGILITHSHPDHIDLAGPLAEAYDCPIWMSNEEIEASGFWAPQIVGIDGRPWAVGSMVIEPIVTPGHTRGSTCYVVGDNAFTGDVLFAEGCGMCPDTVAAHAMFASLETLKQRLRPQTRIFPGHSYGKPPGQRFSELLKQNVYLQFPNQHSFAAFRLRKRQDFAGMFRFC